MTSRASPTAAAICADLADALSAATARSTHLTSAFVRLGPKLQDLEAELEGRQCEGSRPGLLAVVKVGVVFYFSYTNNVYISKEELFMQCQMN